jgi:hypothetical protein
MHRQETRITSALKNSCFETKWANFTPNAGADPDIYRSWKKFLVECPTMLTEENFQAVVLWFIQEIGLPIESSIIVRDKSEYLHAADQKLSKKTSLTLNELSKKPTPKYDAQEMEIWSARNLRIFFLEFLIHSESNISSEKDRPDFDKRVNAILHIYKELLTSTHHARDYLANPQIYSPEKYHFNTLNWKKKVEDEVVMLKELIAANLKPLYTSAQFQYLGSSLEYATDPRGLAFPIGSEFANIISYTGNQPPEIKSKLIDNTLFSAAILDEPKPDRAPALPLAPSPEISNIPNTAPNLRPSMVARIRLTAPLYTTANNILFGLAIGLAGAILFSLIAAAIIYCGPAVVVAGVIASTAIAVKLGLAGIAAIFAATSIIPLLAGLIGGIAHAHHSNITQPANRIKLNNTEMHRDLRTSTHTPITMQDLDANSLSNKVIEERREDLPNRHNPHSSLALTLNASLR